MDVILIVHLHQAGPSASAQDVIIKTPTEVRGVPQVVLRMKVLFICMNEVQHV
jgi:hypothetical protein